MAITTPTSIGTGALSSNAQVVTISVTTAVAIGAHVFVAYYAAGSGAATVTDARGNTYATMNGRAAMTTVSTALQVGDLITVTTGQSASKMVATAVQLTGLTTPLAVDQNSASAGGTGTVMGVGAMSATTSANEIIVTVFAIGGGGPLPGLTPSTGYTNMTGVDAAADGTATSIGWTYKIASATETPAPTVTSASSRAFDGRASSIPGSAPVVASSKSMLRLGRSRGIGVPGTLRVGR